MGPKKERKASLPSATEVKSMTGTETGRVSATKREKRTSQSSVTEMRSSIIQGIEAPNAASVCSFTLNFSAFCVEELADYIPQVNIIGIKRLSHQALLEKISEGSVSEFEKTCEENQPAVQILYENLEKLENLRMIVFKNMMVESGIIRAVGRCLSLYPTITTLKFENCSLSAFDVELIANILHEASSVIDLSLNENEIPQMNYYLLLQDTNLQHLSLCQCAINDEGARYLSNELGFRDQRTQTLLTLNLTHNQITCDGMQFIANALRTNRTLVSLSLAGNRISDRGATYLAEVLTKFPLWHQECVERRCRNLIELLKRKSLIEEQMKQSKNSDESNVKLESKRSLTPKKSKSATKDRKKASRGKVTSDSVTKENISNEFTVTPSAVTPSRNSAEMQKNEQSVDHSLEEDMHPYMQEVKPEDGALWCAERECEELTSPILGSVSLTGRLFGDRATYNCEMGFHVVGLKERTCQADGTWSGHPPACKQNIYCISPPQIEHARHNALPEQTTFDLDSTLQYQCYHGYVTNGFPRAKCLAIDGVASWFGPDISCEPRSCGPPADIPHGWHAGECYTFGCRVTYHCADGYELVGRPDRHCQADGTWSPKELPACVPVQCPPPENPNNGKAIFTSCSYNSVVSYECKYGYILVGEPTRKCGADKRWSGVMPQCKEINCGHPGPLYNGWLENIEAGTGLGASIIFRCHDGMKLVGNTSSVCHIDGHWRYPLPLCLAPCVVPRIQQGRVVLLSRSNNSLTDSPQVVQHGEKLSVECEPRYEFLAANSTPVECNNGTWTHIPRCDPARCKRMPKAPRNGMVIAPKIEHGMRARFKCKDGYTLRGGNITKCLYGNWTGVQPYCQEVYCPFPGYIENGRVMLVGNMGVYDYRPYVRKVTNNKQIMYECERGYVLTEGPPGATCIGGRWSPKQLPRCVPGMHPRLRWSRSVREKRALTSGQNQQHQQLWQRDRRRRNKKGQKSKKRGQKAKARPCEVISEEPHVSIEVVKSGRDPNQTYAPGTVIRVTCGKGYGLNIGVNATAKCARGQWKPSKPECLILPCHIPITENGIYKLSSEDGGGKSKVLNESSTIENGEVVEFSCSHGYNVQGPSNLRCWHGEWGVTSFPDCTPAPCELPMIANGQYLSGYRAGLTIADGSSVNFQCDNDYSKSTGQPIECKLGELKPRVPACRHHTQPTFVYSNGSSKQHEPDVQFKGGSDITKGGDISVIDFPAGFRRACGPPARVQGSLVYRDGEPIGEADRSFPDGTEVTFNCIASIMGEKTTWRIICEDGSWVGRSLNCDGEEVLDGGGMLRNSTCVFRNTEPNLVSFYNDQQITEEVVEFPPGSLLVSRCVDIGKYAMIGSSRRRCVGGEWDGQKPVCFGLNQENDYAMEKPPTILFRHQLGPIAQSNDGRLIVYPGTILHMECLWIRRFGTPKWVISHNYRKYPEGWTTDPGRDSQLEYRLSIYHASRDDSGVFTCVTPTRHTHAVEIVVKAVHCPMIPPRRGLNLNTLNTKMNTKVLLSCANGNSLIGAPEITCLPSGNWSAPIPICESIECADLVNLTDPHLRVSILSREVGGRAVFSCAQGYGLRGPHEAVCQHTGDWASPLPTCQEVQCDTPGTPDNGYIQGNGPYKAGDVIQFNCNPEFMMEGQPIIACQENGRWSGTVPKCVQACSYPGTTISGRMSAVKFYYKIGETITFTCDEGLELRGTPMLRCLRNGKWSNAIPTCVSNTTSTTTTR